MCVLKDIVYVKLLLDRNLGEAYKHHIIPVLSNSVENSNNLQTVRSNSNLYYNSFLPSTIRLWNNLPLLVRNSTTLNEFKKNISGQRIKPPEYYYFGERRVQIYHARLRLECSS